MMFSRLSQLFLVSSIGLIVATFLTACQIVTIDYVVVAASAGNTAGSAGQIYTYAADGHSGALRTGAPTVSSGGTAPVAMAVTSDYANLYVANQGNMSVVHFTIAGNGVLTQKDSVTLTAAPVSLAVNSAGTYLYVVSGTTPFGTLTEYSLSTGVIGSATAIESLTLDCTSSISDFPSDTIVPTGVVVLANSDAVYVSAYDKSAYNPGGLTTSSANPGWLFGFTVSSTGVLAAPSANCSRTAPYDVYEAGVKPSALATDPVDRFVYVTDIASNELIGYTVQSGDALDFMVNGPFKTGNEPSAVTIDPRGIYIYLSNSLDSTVSAYTISLPTGTPSTVVSANNSTDTAPVAIIVDPALGRFVYTANYLGNSVSGFVLNPNTGALTATQATPFSTGANPTALVAVPNGNHATQSTTP